MVMLTAVPRAAEPTLYLGPACKRDTKNCPAGGSACVDIRFSRTRLTDDFKKLAMRGCWNRALQPRTQHCCETTVDSKCFGQCSRNWRRVPQLSENLRIWPRLMNARVPGDCRRVHRKIIYEIISTLALLPRQADYTDFYLEWKGKCAWPVASEWPGN